MLYKKLKKELNNSCMLFKDKYKQPKIGIAFGGGGTRGFAHLGVIKALQEYNLNFDYICGTSAGSLAGAFLAAGYKYDTMLEIVKNISTKEIRNSRLVFVPSKTDGVESIIRDNLGDINIEDLKTPFACVAVDLKTLEECVITKGNLAKACAGSCSVPGIFQPVIFGDRILCDGGLQNTIPADVPKMLGCDYVVAIDVNKSRNFGTDSTKLLDVLSCTIRILMKGNATKGYINADIMVKPETKKFKSTEKDGFEEMIAEGYLATIQVMPEILKLFNKMPLKLKDKVKNINNEKTIL